MTPEERSLLLTVARLFRARLREENIVGCVVDIDDMNEALAPFDPVPNAAALERTDGCSSAIKELDQTLYPNDYKTP